MADEIEIPRKKWKARSMGRYLVCQDQGEFRDIYAGANTIEGARKRKREVSHWQGAYIYDQATDRRI